MKKFHNSLPSSLVSLPKAHTSTTAYSELLIQSLKPYTTTTSNTRPTLNIAEHFHNHLFRAAQLTLKPQKSNSEAPR